MGHDETWSVAADGSGNPYVSGSTTGSLSCPNKGSWDVFLAKYNTDGSLLWTDQIGTSAEDKSYSITVDDSGNAFISGYTKGNLDGTNVGSSDVFLAKYDSSGSLLWTEQLGTSNLEESYSVAVDANGNAYISGFTFGSLCGTQIGSADAFLIKFEVPEPCTVCLLAIGGAILLKRRKA
jgi:hypothetical protein